MKDIDIDVKREEIRCVQNQIIQQQKMVKKMEDLKKTNLKITDKAMQKKLKNY